MATPGTSKNKKRSWEIKVKKWLIPQHLKLDLKHIQANVVWALKIYFISCKVWWLTQHVVLVFWEFWLTHIVVLILKISFSLVRFIENVNKYVAQELENLILKHIKLNDIFILTNTIMYERIGHLE